MCGPLFVATVAAEPGLLPAGVDCGAGVSVETAAGMAAGMAAAVAGEDAGATELVGVMLNVDGLLVGVEADVETPAGLNT